MEQRPSQGRASRHQAVRPQLLDDRLRLSRHAQVHLGARLVGGQAQVPKGGKYTLSENAFIPEAQKE